MVCIPDKYIIGTGVGYLLYKYLTRPLVLTEYKLRKFGFEENFTIHGQSTGVMIVINSINVAWAVTDNGPSFALIPFPTPVNGDLVTIILTNTKVSFFLNGTLIGTNTSYIPTIPLYFGANVSVENNTMTTAMTASIDMMSVKRYI